MLIVLRIGYCERLLERSFASLSRRQVFWLFPVRWRLPDVAETDSRQWLRVNGLSQELQQRDCSGFSPDSLFIDTATRRSRTGMQVQSYTISSQQNNKSAVKSFLFRETL